MTRNDPLAIQALFQSALSSVSRVACSPALYAAGGACLLAALMAIKRPAKV